MRCSRRELGLIGVLALIALFGVTSGAGAQQLEAQFYSKATVPPPDEEAGTRAPHPAGGSKCNGPIRQVVDVGFEGVKTTAWNFAAVGGGGEGGRFAPIPVLTTTVNIVQGVTCLNAHFSAIVGSRQTYGPAFSALALFQVTATPLGGLAPQHLYGHYETPYGIPAPAVAIEAERDVDTFGSNFFQRVGTAPGEIPPGVYRIDVWWAGGPIGGGGAIGAAFVLKLYLG